MTAETTFQYAILRYVHDPVTQEFLNVGVVVYSLEARYLDCLLTTRYARLSNAFKSINGEHFRRQVNHIEHRLQQLSRQQSQPGLFGDHAHGIEAILRQVMSEDDSSLVFGGYGGGLADDPTKALHSLFTRLVDRYAVEDERTSRTEEEVWQVYRKALDQHNLIPQLAPITIHTPTYHYDFDHAWKNERWHPVEPVSFDLMNGHSILEKANKWVGRMTMLADSHNMGTLYMLLGTPQRDDVQQAYHDAVTNLKAKAKVALELVEEQNAAQFSAHLAEMIQSH